MKYFITLTLLFFIPVCLFAQKKAVWKGTISNGFKGDVITFNLSDDGKRLENLTFKGYWRCSGTLEQITMGPEKSFSVKNGKVEGIITEPENGGATAFRFNLNGNVGPKTASGTLRINLNALGCDTYLLKWTASRGG